MKESIEPPSPSNAIDRTQLPPLRIHHLLIWMTVTALLLAVVRFWVDSWNRSHPGTHVQSDPVSWAVAYVLLAGFATISACVITWWWRSLLQKVAPGEWIALIATSDGFLGLINGLIVIGSFRLLGASNVVNRIALNFLPGMCADLFWLLVMVSITRRSSDVRWKCVYLLFGAEKLQCLIVAGLLLTIDVSGFIDTLSSTNDWVTKMLYWLLVAAICAAFYQDIARRRERRWTHWLGIALYLAQSAFDQAFAFWAE